MATAQMGEAVSQARVNGLVEEVLSQGCRSDDDYLWLTDQTRRLVEFTDGYLEILPTPSRGRQGILAFPEFTVDVDRVFDAAGGKE